MTDLYDQAAALPRLLRGDQTPRSYADLTRHGATTPGVTRALRKAALQRPFRGVYLSLWQPADLLDIVRAALLVAPPASVIGFETAALLHGFGVIPPRGVHIVLPPNCPVPQRRGLVAHQSVLPVDDVTEMFGIACLPATRCAIDLARTLQRPDALAVLDAALRAEACGEEDLLAELARHDKLRGVRQARDLVPLATPLAECRQETHLRLVLCDGRLPAPTPQLAVVDEWGVERHRMDLGYEEYQVGVEYDDSSHLDRSRMRLDRRRHNWLSARGWNLRYFTDIDLYRHADLLVTTVREALYRPRSRSFPSIKGVRS